MKTRMTRSRLWGMWIYRANRSGVVRMLQCLGKALSWLMMIAADKISLYTDDEIQDILDEVWANPILSR